MFRVAPSVIRINRDPTLRARCARGGGKKVIRMTQSTIKRAPTVESHASTLPRCTVRIVVLWHMQVFTRSSYYQTDVPPRLAYERVGFRNLCASYLNLGESPATPRELEFSLLHKCGRKMLRRSSRFVTDL